MPLVTFQQDGSLGEIIIDSPPLNLFSGYLLADLSAAFDQAAASDIRALMLRAEGEDFSAGADVSVFAGLEEAEAKALEETVLALMEAIEELGAPQSHQGSRFHRCTPVCVGGEPGQRDPRTSEEAHRRLKTG